jgi:hypothetical protein
MKKEIIKPFDLEAYKKGAKVKTRNGREVRIICTDSKNEYFPIIALIKIDDNNETVLQYTSNGKAQLSQSIISGDDLVIVEEPEFWSDDKSNTFSGFCINNVAGISEVAKVPNEESYYDVFATEKQAKSALAMARISQIMANDIENFGGAVTNEEWKNNKWKHVIYRNGCCISTTAIMNDYYFLAFHTPKQRGLFLKKYYDLVKDFLMID